MIFGAGQKLLMARAGVVPPTPITPWDDIAIASTSFIQSSPTLTDGTDNWWPNGMFFKPDGTKMFIMGWRNTSGTSDLVEFSLSTAWDISTISYTTKVLNVASYGRGCSFKRDGTALFFYENNETMSKYTLSSAWDLSTASLDSSNSTSFAAYTSTQPRNPFFSEDGKTVLLCDNNNDDLYQFSLSTAWDISTSSVSYDGAFSTVSYTTHPRDVFASSTGDQIFLLDNGGAVYKFTTTDFDVTSLVADGSYSDSGFQSSLFIDYDNLKMYSGTISDIASEYDIATDFSSVQLLLHMDGASGGTTFTDSSNNNFTVTSNGVNTNTTTKKFGSASAEFSPPDYLSISQDTNLDLGTGDFTFECFAYLNSTASDNNFLGNTYSASFDTYQLRYRNGTGFQWVSVNRAVKATFAATMNTSQWYHVALCRSSGDLYCFLDGQQVGSTVTDNTDYKCGTNLAIGRGREDVGTQNYNGFIDEVRLTVGLARYTADFTPPTSAFPDQ